LQYLFEGNICTEHWLYDLANRWFRRSIWWRRGQEHLFKLMWGFSRKHNCILRRTYLLASWKATFTGIISYSVGRWTFINWNDVGNSTTPLIDSLRNGQKFKVRYSVDCSKWPSQQRAANWRCLFIEEHPARSIYYVLAARTPVIPCKTSMSPYYWNIPCWSTPLPDYSRQEESLADYSVVFYFWTCTQWS